MTRIMQDSTNTAAFTAGADLYAGYVLSDTGQGYNNYASMAARFPGAVHVSICTRFNATAQVLDFEAGTTGVLAADAQQAVQWVQRMRAQGLTPSVYVQQSLWGWLQGYFISNHVAQPNWWVANTSTGAVMIPGTVAHQYTFNLPRNPYDTSIVADYWPGVDSGDVPSGGGTPIGGNDLGTIDNTASNRAVISQAVAGILFGTNGDQTSPLYGAPNPVNWYQWVGDFRGQQSAVNQAILDRLAAIETKLGITS